METENELPAGTYRTSCPLGCGMDRVLTVDLPGRSLTLCGCRHCKTLFLQGPDGTVTVTLDELRALGHVRQEYQSGILVP